MKYTDIEYDGSEVRIAEDDANAWSVGITRETIQRILKSDLGGNPGDMLALWMFYAYTARWQKTNQVKATVSFCMKGLVWGDSRVRNARRGLMSLGLIEDIQDRSDKGFNKGWYVKVKHLVRTTLPQNGSVATIDHTPLKSKLGRNHSGDNPPTNALGVNKKNTQGVNKRRNALGVSKDLSALLSETVLSVSL